LPFVVATNHLDICVLGTQFNLQAYPFDRRTITTLESGSVAVRKKNQPNSFITLEPNQQLDYENRSGRFNKTDIDASVYSGWTKGEMNFISQSLREILRTLERSYAVSIQLSSDLMESNRINSDLYTIKFKRRDDIFHVLDIVTKTVGGITYKVEKDESISICPLK
ncbi:FecR family protein, partial [Bacteroides uniformis]